MTRRAAALALAFFFLAGPARAADVVERIVAVVNDEIVTDQDLDIVMAPVAQQYRTLYTGQELDAKLHEARQEFLQKVIEDKLILSEAKRLQVIVKDEEVDDILSDVRNKFPTRDAFLKAIEGQGLTEKKLWNRFRDQLMSQKLVQYEVKSRVSVSPGEVSTYYKEHANEFVQGDRVKLQQILLRTSSRTEEDAKALADEIRAKLDAGASFEALATEYSEGAEAKEGGNMGWMESGQLLGDIEEQVFKLEKGGVTPPIKSTLGYHIFKVVEREQVSVKPLAEVRDNIQDRLFKEKMQKRLEAWIQGLKKDAYISIR